MLISQISTFSICTKSRFPPIEVCLAIIKLRPCDYVGHLQLRGMNDDDHKSSIVSHSRFSLDVLPLAAYKCPQHRHPRSLQYSGGTRSSSTFCARTATKSTSTVSQAMMLINSLAWHIAATDFREIVLTGSTSHQKASK